MLKYITSLECTLMIVKKLMEHIKAVSLNRIIIIKKIFALEFQS